MEILEKLENQIDNFANHRIGKLPAPDVESYFLERETKINDERVKVLRDTLSIIRNDHSSLLTHISAMIAALGITLIVFQEERVTQFFIFIEMISYTLLAIACVISIRHKGGRVPLEKGLSTIEDYYLHYLRRRYLYILCSNGVIITTIVFLLTILIHLIALIFTMT